MLVNLPHKQRAVYAKIDIIYSITRWHLRIDLLNKWDIFLVIRDLSHSCILTINITIQQKYLFVILSILVNKPYTIPFLLLFVYMTVIMIVVHSEFGWGTHRGNHITHTCTQKIIV